MILFCFEERVVPSKPLSFHSPLPNWPCPAAPKRDRGPEAGGQRLPRQVVTSEAEPWPQVAPLKVGKIPEAIRGVIWAPSFKMNRKRVFEGDYLPRPPSLFPSLTGPSVHSTPDLLREEGRR